VTDNHVKFNNEPIIFADNGREFILVECNDTERGCSKCELKQESDFHYLCNDAKNNFISCFGSKNLYWIKNIL